MSHGGDQLARPKMPGAVIGVIVILLFQALVNAFFGVAILDLANGAHWAGVLSLAVAAVCVLCVAFTFVPRSWVRTTVIGVEALAILAGLINLLGGAPAGVVGIAIAAGAIRLVTLDRSVEWYGR